MRQILWFIDAMCINVSMLSAERWCRIVNTWQRLPD